MLKDTWSGIIEQMHELGLTAIVRLFKINYNLRFPFSSTNTTAFKLMIGQDS